ncbi:MAG: TadE/TadG family type IV pilus assembly protein [Jatrophihabitantaceae bacterium]
MRLRQLAADDSGNAIVEFVFVALVVLVPLIYLIVTVAVLQRARLATTNAARDVGRAIATADDAAQADTRAQAALRIALANQGLSPSDVQLRYVAADADCVNGPDLAPQLVAGGQFQVCVIRHQALPAVPTVLAGRGVVTIGRYLVHLDDYRTFR